MDEDLVDDPAAEEARLFAFDQIQIAERQRIVQEHIKHQAERRDMEIMMSPREALKRAIRSKPMWEEKVTNENISKKYRAEAVEQGVSTAVVDSVMEQLREEASYILGTSAAGASSSTSGKAVRPANKITSPVDFEEMNVAVLAVHDKLATGDRIIVEGLEEEGNGVWFADKVVPPKLRELLESRLDVIANSPKKDFHPGSDDQVQDLIHPSLFPYIKDVSYVKDPANLPQPVAVSYFSRQYEDSTYQWLPAEFLVDEKGSVKIETYINNLEERTNQDLYRAIELIFGLFVPIFKKVSFEERALDLYNRKLQVIVKAANYVIQPKGQVYEGSWHVEGMSHEQIVATGIYYYSTSHFLKDGGLEFRRERDEEADYPQIDQYDWSMQDEMGDDFPNVDGLQMTIRLGAVPTVEDRLLVFPNGLQHKVSGIVNDSEDQVGIRKILVFFLVDPDREIVSTRHVPPQQWERFAPELMVLMSLVIKRVMGKSFEIPVPIIEEIVSRAKCGLTMEEARRHRLELMRERKYKVEHDNQEWEREYSLCEH